MEILLEKSGRNAVRRELPSLKKIRNWILLLQMGKMQQMVLALQKICEEFYSIGVDVITSGNHIWDQKEIVEHIENRRKINKTM